jgi:hypothetical protein
LGSGCGRGFLGFETGQDSGTVYLRNITLCFLSVLDKVEDAIDVPQTHYPRNQQSLSVSLVGTDTQPSTLSIGGGSVI